MTRSVPEELPERFCWTRFGVEAGEPIDRILERKEIERQRNQGLFYWGIGNSVGPGIREMIRQYTRPEALFSPIAGPPRPADASPTYVVAWTQGETLWGDSHPVPDHSLVTSRLAGPSDGRAHYALVCFSSEPLALSPEGPPLAFDSLRNLLSGRRVGASQVTAVVRREPGRALPGRQYTVALRAQLVYPYFLRLTHPVALGGVMELRGAAATRSSSSPPVPIGFRARARVGEAVDAACHGAASQVGGNSRPSPICR